MSVNKVVLLGRLGKDPELKYLPSGTAMCKLSVATTEVYKKGEEKVEDTTWHRVIAWGRQAEIISEYILKGQEIFIEGRLKYRTFDKEDGTKGYVTEVILTGFSFVGGRGTKTTGKPPEEEGSPEIEQPKEEEDDLPF